MKVDIEGLSIHKCESVENCLLLFETGKMARVTAETESNFTSSRSHAILRITVTTGEENNMIREGNLFLVDLAGSERLDKSKAEGIEKMRQQRSTYPC